MKNSVFGSHTWIFSSAGREVNTSRHQGAALKPLGTILPCDIRGDSEGS